MSNNVDLLKYVPVKYHDSALLNEFFSVVGSSLPTIASADKLYNISNWLDLIDELESFFDPNTVAAAQLKHLAALIGLKLLPANLVSESILRSTILQAIDWYRVKGTYQSLKIIALINQMTFNVLDMYTDTNYTTFHGVPWFVGGENENPTNYPYPTYFKSPHFGLEIVLNHVYDTDSLLSDTYMFLWHYSFLDNVKKYVEKTRPVHTVPHYSLLLLPCASEDGSVIIEDGNIQTVAQLNWGTGLIYFDQNASYDSTIADNRADWTFDENTNSDLVTDYTFDQASTITTDLIDKWRLATGNRNSALEVDSTLIGHWKLNDSANSLTVVDFSSYGHNGTSVQNTSLMHSLRAHWRMNDTTGTTVVDDSGGGHDGTSNNAITSADGIIGTSIEFTSASEDYVSVANSAEWQLGAGDFTFSEWVKFKTLTNTQALISYAQSPSSYWAFVKDGNNYIQFVSSVNGTLYGSYYYQAEFMTTNTWYHIVFGRSGTTAFLYINNVKYELYEAVAFGTNNLDISQTGDPALVFGATNYAVAPVGPPPDMNFLNGYIDDVRMYRHAFSSDDVSYLYNFGIGTSLALPEGVIGNALTFNGTTDYIDCGDINDSEGTATLSISVRMFPTSASNQMVLGKQGSYYLYRLADGRIQWAIYPTTPAEWAVATSDDVCSLNEWSHVVGTYDGTTIRLYVNNVQQSPYVCSATSITVATANTFRIGTIVSSSLLFHGKLDDVRLYNKVLTDKDVDDLYSIVATSDLYSTSYSKYVRPIVHLKMDETSGTTVADYSGNNIDGTTTYDIEATGMSVDGICGTALRLVSATENHITIAHDTLLNFGLNSYSYCVWLNMETSGVKSQIVYKVNGAVYNFNLYTSTNRRLYCHISDGVTYKTARSASLIVGDAIWHHIAVVVNRTTNKLLMYVDGVQQPVIADLSDISAVGNCDNTGALVFNSTHATYTNSFDDFRIYGTALAATDVAYIYNEGHGIVEYTGSISQDDITIYDDKVEIEFTVPKAIALDGVSEMNIFANGDTSSESEVVTSLFPSIYKSTDSTLRVLTTVYRK